MDRFVIFPDEIHISHSMRTLINKGKYEITFNEAFQDVAYKPAENCGWNKKAPARNEDDGSLYAPARTRIRRQRGSMGRRAIGRWAVRVTLGRCFFGESMFSLVPSASKLALIHLAPIL